MQSFSAHLDQSHCVCSCALPRPFSVILSGADLSLVYGRRYGLVGRNGVGKTTLLRTMANRELQLPPHISILHVEQEVR